MRELNVAGGRDERTRWRAAAHAYALLVAAGVAYCVARMPIQVSDCLGNLLQIQDVPLARVVADQMSARAYMRPLLWAQIKVVSDLSGGHYFAAFKTVHALQLFTLAVLFVRPLRIRTSLDFAPLPLAMAVLVGLHTFSGTVREAFPINTFLTIVLFCVAAVNLSVSRPRAWIDAAAVLLLTFAVLTLESGVLVFVCLAAAWGVGFRGVSRTGIFACAAVIGVYLLARFAVLDVGAPGLTERPSGFGFEILEPSALAARFGDNPLPFYAYNVAASLLSLLFSEPRAGVFWAVRSAATGGTLPTWLVLNLVSSALATALIGWYVLVRAREVWHDGGSERDGLVAVAVAVVAANAVISFAYTKDVILSPAGVFYATAVYVAARELVIRTAALSNVPLRSAVAVLAVTGAMAWAVRDAAIHLNLRQWAFRERNQWAHVSEWLDEQGIRVTTPSQRALVAALQADALSRPVPAPARSRWIEWFDLN